MATLALMTALAFITMIITMVITMFFCPSLAGRKASRAEGGSNPRKANHGQCLASVDDF